MTTPEEYLASVDRSGFSIAGYHKVTPKPWGEEFLLTADDAPYAMKLIHILAGKRLSLQAHDHKTETWVVHSGDAMVIIEDADGNLQEVRLEPFRGYTSSLGQRHRLLGISDTWILEASTPELGTTYRLEDDYARPDETEELRAAPNRGWNG